MVAHRRLSGFGLWLGVAVSAIAIPLALGPASMAQAFWSDSGSGSGAAAAATMPTGTAPSGSARSTAVTITFSAAYMADGTAVAGYRVSRYNSSGTPATVHAGCSGVITKTICTEDSVPTGTWFYTVTPVQGSWTGGQSPQSASITVT